jgi:hypothetical protein
MAVCTLIYVGRTFISIYIERNISSCSCVRPMPGVSHFPFCEASELWIEKSVAFVASLGFERCAAARE